MTKPLFTILLPHLRNDSNNEALRICLDCLVANTGLNYELMLESVAERRDIYAVLNSMAARAVTDWLVPINTDTFAAPGWAEPMWQARAHYRIVSPVLVECGAIPVNDRNLQKDFGRKPETFRRAEFEAWVQAGGGWRDDWHTYDEAWYHPALIERDAFLGMSGYNTSIGEFPAELDMDFHERWKADGRGFQRVNSYFYHLQAYNEPERGNRG